MGQREADDWLRVAVGEVSYFPTDILSDACRDARRTATHHAQIIPAIIKYADERLAIRRKAATALHEIVPAPHRITQDQWAPTQSEIDAIKAYSANALSANRNAE